MKFFFVLLTLVSSICYAYKLNLRVVKKIVATSVIVSFSQFVVDVDNLTFSPISQVHADSTGKFSTKLTAKRRYYPRIVNAIPIFKDIENNKKTPAEIKSYIESESFADLSRAFTLYGASLRKGELPDDVSRATEKLSEAFSRDCTKYASSSGNTETLLKSCVKDFNDYVSFAGIEGK